MKIKLVVLFLMLTSNISNVFFTQQVAEREDGYILLMRLQTQEKTIEEMEKRGFKEQAAQRRKDTKERHEYIVRAYKEYFDFCPVYFFYSSDSKAILSGKYEGKILNDKLESVDFNPDPTKGLLVADYGMANPTGETYRFNNDGIKVNYIKDGKIVGFNSDYSYQGVSRGVWLFLSKYQKVARSIKKINRTLRGVGYLGLDKEKTW